MGAGPSLACARQHTLPADNLPTCNRQQRRALTTTLNSEWHRRARIPAPPIISACGLWSPVQVVWRRRRGMLFTRNPRWRGCPQHGIRFGEALHPGPSSGPADGGGRDRERSPPRGQGPMQVDTKVFCPVPNCPCSDPLRARGWRSIASMQSHIDAHLAGSLAGEVPPAWLAQQHRQRCAVCSLSVSTRFGIHPTCRPDARAAATGQVPDGGSQHLPSILDIQGGSTPTLRRVPAAARQSWHKALSRALALVAHCNTDASWQELLMLPQAVLDAPPRGGKKHRKALVAYTLDRLERWHEGERLSLWNSRRWKLFVIRRSHKLVSLSSAQIRQQQAHSGPVSWDSFSDEYMERLQSDLFDGGTKQPYKLPRRSRHKRRVPDSEKGNEVTRDLIAILKQCLNQGTSVHQIGHIISQVLSPQENANHTSTSNRKKPKQAKKADPPKEVSSSEVAQPVVRFWTDRVTGTQRAYTVDSNGWWSWLPHSNPHPAPPAKASWSPSPPTHKLEAAPGSREARWVSGLRAADWDPGVVPKLVSVQKIREALKEGAPLTGNIVEIWNPEVAAELQTLWDSFAYQEGMTALLFGQAKKDTAGTLHTRLSISRGSFGPKLEETGLLKIGPGKGPWLPTSHKVDMKSTPKVQRETLRVSAPSVFRAPFIGNCREDSSQAVIRSLAALSDTSVSEFVGGRWSTQEAKHGTQLIVFLRLKLPLVQKLVECSGKHGLFMTHIVTKPNPDFTPFWIRRNTAEANDAYLRRVLMLKDSRKQPVLFRFGPGDNLGFEKRAEDTIAPKPRNHVIYGLPRAWGADDVETLLANQNWSQVGHIVRRKRSWVVSAQAPPDSATRTSWHYDLQYSDQAQDSIAVTIQVAVRSHDRLEVRQHLPGPRKVQDPAVRVAAASAQQRATEENAVTTATEDPSKVQAAAPAEARDSKDKDERGRSRSRGRDATALTQIDPGSQMEQDQEGDSSTAALEETKTKKQKVGEPIDPADAVQNFKWREWDQGGSGDCFYRSCSLFLKDFHAQPDRERSRQEGAWLRSETVKHIRKHSGRFQELFQNFEEYKAWQTKCGNASTWAEGKAIQACSEKIGRPVVVWEKKQDSDGVITYNRFVLAPRFSRGFACSADDKVICVILCDKHYTALLPPRDSKFPASWLRETPGVVIQLDGGTSAGHGSGAEGVRAGSSSAHPTQHSLVPVVSLPQVLPGPSQPRRSDCDFVIPRFSSSGISDPNAAAPSSPPRLQVSSLSQGEGRRAEGASPAARSARSSGCGRPLRRLRAKTLCSLASSECSCAGAHSVAPSVWSPSRSLPDLPTPSVHSVVPASLGPSLRTRSVHTLVSGSGSQPGLPTPSAHTWVHSAHASSQPNSLRPWEPSLAGFASSDPANQPLGKQHVWDLPDAPATGLVASKDQNLAVNVGDQEFIWTCSQCNGVFVHLRQMLEIWGLRSSVG
eukprot:Skav233161  [mRNA]  locus=scaffold1669:495717:501543:+ [translate_table: standard]